MEGDTAALEEEREREGEREGEGERVLGKWVEMCLKSC